METEKANKFKEIKVEYKEPVFENDTDFYRSQNFDFALIKNRKHIVTIVVPDTSAATAANYGVFFIAPFACRVASIREVHKTAGSDAGTVALNVEKLTGTEALDSGDALLATAFNLKGTANTVQTGTLVVDNSVLNLAVGDRLALDDSGTLTAVAHVVVTLELIY